MQRFLRKAAANTNASSHFSVGADAYIGPLGSCEFAENLRENGAFCRADVGIGPYKQVGSCGTNSHWAFASCNCLLRTSQSASLTAPLSGEPGALPRQVHAREKLQLHQPSAAVGADGVVHVVQIAAVGTGFLAHKTLLSVKNALCSCEQRANDRGTTSGLPVPCGSGLTERRHAPAQ